MRKNSGIENVNYLKRCYQKNPDIVFRKIAGEIILVPIRQNVGDLESIYTLNEIAAKIWELIDGKRTVEEIKEIMLNQFEVSEKDIENDLTGLLDNFRKMRFIIPQA